MITISDILKHRVIINQIINDWGYKNPRLFKGIIITNDADIIRDESHILNILVDDVENQNLASSKRMLELDLERLLAECKVVVSLEDEFSQEYTYKIQEAVSLNNESSIIEYFGLEWQFEGLRLNERALAAQHQAYEYLDFIKSELNKQKNEKLRRVEQERKQTSYAENLELCDEKQSRLP